MSRLTCLSVESQNGPCNAIAIIVFYAKLIFYNVTFSKFARQQLMSLPWMMYAFKYKINVPCTKKQVHAYVCYMHLWSNVSIVQNTMWVSKYV